jgi:hypothetical protein
MRKSRMFSRLICKIRQSKLPHAPQPLKLRSVDQPRYQPTLGRPRIQPNYVMHRIAVVSFRQSALSRLERSFNIMKKIQNNGNLSQKTLMNPPFKQFIFPLIIHFIELR